MSALPPPIRSSFVTVLGWIFVCLAGFATLMSLLQNLMFQLVFLPAMQQQLATQPMPAEMPVPVGWLFAHIIWFFRAFLLVSVTALIASIGLLLRRNWGRRLFIGLMGFAIAYHVLGLAFQWWFMGSMQSLMPLPPNAPAHFADGIRGFMRAMQMFGAIMAIGFSVLYGWIIKRLCSPAVQREFGPVNISSSFPGDPK
jgi:hypothetical protein